MKTKLSSLSSAALALLATLLLAGPALGQGQHVYAVNFTCGFQSSADGSAGYEPMVKVANYAVKIDVYNYRSSSLALSGDVLETSGSHWVSSPVPTALAGGMLAAGGATVLDCTDIATTLASGGPLAGGKPFLSGVVTIRSPQPLIVWVTKTTEVCAGLVQVSETAHLDPDILVFDENMVLIPPGLCSRQVIPSLGSDMVAEDLSVSHSIDTERVEGVFLP